MNSEILKKQHEVDVNEEMTKMTELSTLAQGGSAAMNWFKHRIPWLAAGMTIGVFGMIWMKRKV